MTPVESPPSAGRVPGSFRDPSGYVFERSGEIYRAADRECGVLLRGLLSEEVFRRLVDQGAIVATQFVDRAELLGELSTEHPGFADFLRHQRIENITYPYEWSIGMLADAAVHTLDLQVELLSSGYSLKDATPYNVQFVRGKPVFIDVASIERPRRLDVWFALGQFSQMFLFPLLLARYRGWDLRSYFLGSLGGRAIEAVARSFGRLQRLRPGLLLDVTFPYVLHRWAEKGQRAKREVLEKENRNAQPQLMNLRRLRAKVLRIARGCKPRGIWTRYTSICNYDQTADKAKRELVVQFLSDTRPARVLDVGCNTGEYSRLAAKNGADVVAIDSDEGAIELLYRRLRAEEAAITPMVVDLCNPSPAIGFLNEERPSFLDRAKADCVLALALIHHLLVSGNLSLEAICDMLSRLTRRDVVVEFVPPDDEMFRRLLKYRVDLFGGVTLEEFRRQCARRFHVLNETPIANSKRTLLFLRKLGP